MTAFAKKSKAGKKAAVDAAKAGKASGKAAAASKGKGKK